MFNLNSEVQRLFKLRELKNKPVKYRPKKDPAVSHIDGTTFEIDAEREGAAIPHSFHNHSLGFGRRLSKAKGQYHRPGGGFAGHNKRG